MDRPRTLPRSEPPIDAGPRELEGKIDLNFGRRTLDGATPRSGGRMERDAPRTTRARKESSAPLGSSPLASRTLPRNLFLASFKLAAQLLLLACLWTSTASRGSTGDVVLADSASRTLPSFATGFIQVVSAAKDEDNNEDDDEPAPPAKAGKAEAAASDEEDAATSTGSAFSKGVWLTSSDYKYLGLFLVLMGGCGYLVRQSFERQTKEKNASVTTPEHKALERDFLLGYGLASAADWMQGPFVYKLYSFLGFSKGEIGLLFVVGYFSSMVFGTLIAGLADRLGRKRICLLYCVVYGLSCLTKHGTEFNVLLLGQILAGVSTSILHSSFEAWYVAQHRNDGLPEEWLHETLSWTGFVRGLSAVAAGLLSAISAAAFGFVAPFDVALVLALSSAGWIHLRWRENYGDRAAPPGASLALGWLLVVNQPRVLLLGLAQACFESATYLFVFAWTPTLEATTSTDLPHGLIFACFMVSMMIGARATVMPALRALSAEDVAALACGGAAAGLLLPALTESHAVVLLAYCLFEFCAGMYYPSIATQRAKHIPNEVRASVMAVHRVPVNIVVVLALLSGSQTSAARSATYACGLTVAAALAERAIVSLSSNGGALGPV